MSHLNAELQRLFLFEPVPETGQAALVDAQGRVRAMVIELARPARWAELAQVWRGVQSELDWPAPAIAVNGVDGYQLWFPLAVPLTAAQAAACLQTICKRCLPGVGSERLRLWPAEVGGPAGEPPVLPPARHQAEGGDEVWAAFVAPDLAPVFEDTPWLDMPPGQDGQTGLLARVKTLGAADLQHAWQSWQIGASSQAQRGATSTATTATSTASSSSAEPAAQVVGASPELSASASHTDPRRFLLAVMNDPNQPMRWRIEAAKALMPAAPQPAV
ncbi:MAG: hypothetical protein RI907_370 [Pseudomonadota bacterium]|jgi:hypothetical protein